MAADFVTRRARQLWQQELERMLRLVEVTIISGGRHSIADLINIHARGARIASTPSEREAADQAFAAFYRWRDTPYTLLWPGNPDLPELAENLWDHKTLEACTKENGPFANQLADQLDPFIEEFKADQFPDDTSGQSRLSLVGKKPTSTHTFPSHYPPLQPVTTPLFTNQLEQEIRNWSKRVADSNGWSEPTRTLYESHLRQRAGAEDGPALTRVQNAARFLDRDKPYHTSADSVTLVTVLGWVESALSVFDDLSTTEPSTAPRKPLTPEQLAVAHEYAMLKGTPSHSTIEEAPLIEGVVNRIRELRVTPGLEHILQENVNVRELFFDPKNLESLHPEKKAPKEPVKQDVSGSSVDELIARTHEFVRHPNAPDAADHLSALLRGIEDAKASTGDSRTRLTLDAIASSLDASLSPRVDSEPPSPLPPLEERQEILRIAVAWALLNKHQLPNESVKNFVQGHVEALIRGDPSASDVPPEQIIDAYLSRRTPGSLTEEEARLLSKLSTSFGGPPISPEELGLSASTSHPGPNDGKTPTNEPTAGQTAFSSAADPSPTIPDPVVTKGPPRDMSPDPKRTIPPTFQSTLREINPQNQPKLYSYLQTIAEKGDPGKLLPNQLTAYQHYFGRQLGTEVSREELISALEEVRKQSPREHSPTSEPIRTKNTVPGPQGPDLPGNTVEPPGPGVFDGQPSTAQKAPHDGPNPGLHTLGKPAQREPRRTAKEVGAAFFKPPTQPTSLTPPRHPDVKFLGNRKYWANPPSSDPRHDSWQRELKNEYTKLLTERANLGPQGQSASYAKGKLSRVKRVSMHPSHYLGTGLFRVKPDPAEVERVAVEQATRAAHQDAVHKPDSGKLTQPTKTPNNQPPLTQGVFAPENTNEVPDAAKLPDPSTVVARPQPTDNPTPPTAYEKPEPQKLDSQAQKPPTHESPPLTQGMFAPVGDQRSPDASPEEPDTKGRRQRRGPTTSVHTEKSPHIVKDDLGLAHDQKGMQAETPRHDGHDHDGHDQEPDHHTHQL